jgi:hypothetical protein
MNEIPFIKALGDALDTAMAGSKSHSERSSRGPGRFRRPRKRLALALVGLAAVVAGGAAADSLLLGSSQRLAAGTVNCFFGTRGKTISLARRGRRAYQWPVADLGMPEVVRVQRPHGSKGSRCQVRRMPPSGDGSCRLRRNRPRRSVPESRARPAPPDLSHRGRSRPRARAGARDPPARPRLRIADGARR